MTAPVATPHPAEVPTRASALVADALAPLTGVDLPTVLEQAALQTRVDRKYLVPAQSFTELLTRLGERYSVLEIDGRRLFQYESVYFDTPQLHLYRQHLQGRRLRYKVRTRTYVDSGICMFEVKLKGRRSQTAKARFPHPAEHRAALTDEAHRLLDDLLHAEYGIGAPELAPVVTTRYLRGTLVDLAEGNRFTCDLDLVCQHRGRTADGLTDQILVESKTVTGNSTADRILRELGVRPVSISKYCVALALLNPTVVTNPWNRVLRHHFDWRPKSHLREWNDVADPGADQSDTCVQIGPPPAT
ncbi:VTC domain-containing protein [Actinopolymorpha cephalotaxi]|uniref:VTC domain-containing protein n=1 Tax=Actinopolymorpha cephalotaxi TaxID=504797 RepID=A0A1I2MUU4_9ACTN|nr:polyphosphate polymerase domain-containing protein [Actinopolymorpha cephalotaxi]NYH85849.1 hypothetical protein [Actinopolymorpha cephalotaxi]SFF94670.1 VTC domain-containing protein [Actinopolymorpha cephalotaxi]